MAWRAWSTRSARRCCCAGRSCWRLERSCSFEKLPRSETGSPMSGRNRCWLSVLEWLHSRSWRGHAMRHRVIATNVDESDVERRDCKDHSRAARVACGGEFDLPIGRSACTRAAGRACLACFDAADSASCSSAQRAGPVESDAWRHSRRCQVPGGSDSLASTSRMSCHLHSFLNWSLNERLLRGASFQ
ncbi:hypothetical protein BH11PSE13_BH11PSE13_43410 [soil metagenome]